MNLTQNATLQSPQTTGQLLKYIAKRIPERLLKSLPVIIVVGISSWLIHTYLLVFVNEGFNPDSWLANNFLNVKGSFISSTLLWGMIGALIPMTISFFMTGGNPVKSFTAMAKMPMDIYRKNKASNNALLPVILISCGITLLFDKLLSGVAGLVAGGILMSSVVAFVTGRGSIFIMMFRMIFTDIQTYVLKKKNKGLDSESIYMIIGSSGLVLVLFGLLQSTNIIGRIFGLFMRLIPVQFIFVILSFILSAVNFFIGSIWFIMLAAGIVMILIKSNKKVPSAMIFMALFAFGTMAAERILGVRIFADDGGWMEAGGTWSGWIGSEGSLIAVINGLPPAVSGITGAVISSILSGATGGLGGSSAGVAAGSGFSPDIPSGDTGTTPPSDTSDDTTPPADNTSPDEKPPMSEEERQKWIEQERQKAKEEAEEAKRQHDELMAKRRQEYENAQKLKELEAKKAAAQKELDRIRKAKEERDAYIQKLCDKYKTTPDKLRDVIRQNMNMSQAEADKWNQRANALAVAEAAAQATVVAADLLIDGMAAAGGPAGRAVRAGYKVAKGAASSAATDGLSVKNIVSGAVSGGADAATDFIDNKYVKAGVTVVGETVGGAIKGGSKGAWDGLKNGVYNAGMNAVTDKVVDKFGGKGFGNDVRTSSAPGGKVRVDVTDYKGLKPNGGNWSGRNVSSNVANKFITNKQNAQVVQTAVKSVPTIANEFVAKPLAQDKGYLPK